MKTLQLSLFTLLPVAAAFNVHPSALQTRRIATKLYTSMPMDGRKGGKMSYPRQDFPFKEVDMERAKVRRITSSSAVLWW